MENVEKKKKATMPLQRQLEMAIKNIEAAQAVCSAARDNLRTRVDEAQAILDSWDEADGDMEAAVSNLRDAIDTMSQYV